MKSERSNCVRLLIVPVIGLSLLAGCATVASSPIGSCPPVAEYPQETLNRAADELELLPDGSAIETLLSGYNVLREQVRACN